MATRKPIHVKFPFFKNEKTAFPDEVFNEIWLIIAEHNKKCISEMKFEKVIYRLCQKENYTILFSTSKTIESIQLYEIPTGVSLAT